MYIYMYIFICILIYVWYIYIYTDITKSVISERHLERETPKGLRVCLYCVCVCVCRVSVVCSACDVSCIMRVFLYVSSCSMNVCMCMLACFVVFMRAGATPFPHRPPPRLFALTMSLEPKYTHTFISINLCDFSSRHLSCIYACICTAIYMYIYI